MIRRGEIEEVILLAAYALYKNRAQNIDGDHIA